MILVNHFKSKYIDNLKWLIKIVNDGALIRITRTRQLLVASYG
jgi:hypothetical protein